MKKIKYLTFSILSLVLTASCTDEDNDKSPGNPVIDAKTGFTGAYFGDHLPFTIGVSDHVPLSTLTARLYFGDRQVAETVIRTKENGDYSGSIYVPFYKDIPDGTATLEFTLTDIRLSSVTKSFDLPVSRPAYPYLILVAANASYPMRPTGAPNEYAATEAFPSTDFPAYIKTPAFGERGSEITFGWEGGAVREGVTAAIPFISPQAGVYSVTFNTKTYAAAPFFEVLVNGQKLRMADRENFTIDLNLTQGETLTVEGIPDIADWWTDPDFFTKVSDNQYGFVPIAGRYRITANTTHRYFNVEVMSDNAPATLQPDGAGAIWVIGTDVGKPSVTGNEVGWNTDKALCMSPVGGGKYRLTLTGGRTVNTGSINFKFFHQKGWGGEFASNLTTASDIVFVGSGGDSGRDPGNLGIVAGKTLEEGATYVFTVDVSAGIDHAVLTVEKK